MLKWHSERIPKTNHVLKQNTFEIQWTKKKYLHTQIILHKKTSKNENICKAIVLIVIFLLYKNDLQVLNITTDI